MYNVWWTFWLFESVFFLKECFCHSESKPMGILFKGQWYDQAWTLTFFSLSIQTIHSLKCLKWPYKVNGSLKGDNLVVIYYLLSASEIWPDKRPGVAILVQVTCRNSIPRVDMLLHLDTLSTHWANPSLFLLLNVPAANNNFVVFAFCLSWLSIKWAC